MAPSPQPQTGDWVRVADFGPVQTGNDTCECRLRGLGADWTCVKKMEKQENTPPEKKLKKLKKCEKSFKKLKK